MDCIKYLQFLREFQWVFDFKLTDFLIKHPWTSLPASWISYLDGFNFDKMKNLLMNENLEGLPDSFRYFVHQCNELNILKETSDIQSLCTDVDLSIYKKMAEKKRYEIEMLVPFIIKMCEKYKCEGILDIGCGLGHLCTILASKFKCVIGIDSVTSHCKKAAYKSAINQFSNVQFVSLHVDDSNACCEKITEMLKMCSTGKLEKIKFAIIGLHCCGDLQPTILKVFEKLPTAEIAMTVGCCYHKMKSTGEESNQACFSNNFPMSEQAKCLFQNAQTPTLKLNVYAFRLASQDSKHLWKTKTDDDFLLLGKNIFYRAVAECLKIEGISLRKSKRRLALQKDLTRFENYVETLIKRAEVSKRDAPYLSNKEFRQKMNCYYDLNIENFKYVDIFILLQTLMQGVLESFILLDRIQYLYEKQMQVEHIPVFDVMFSPRNQLILVNKNNTNVDG